MIELYYKMYKMSPTNNMTPTPQTEGTI